MNQQIKELSVAHEHRIEKQASKSAPISIGNDGQLTDEQFEAVKKFVEELGGIENARRAVAALKELGKAA